MLKRLYSYFSDPKKLAILNGALLVLLVTGNSYFQAFCIPTNWTIVFLTICFVNTILSPFATKHSLLGPLTSFISGLSLFVFIYCILFLEQMNLIGLLMILYGIGLLIFIPHFFVAQLLWKTLIRPSVKTSRLFFLSAVLLCLGTTYIIGKEYKKAMVSIEKFEQSDFEQLDKTFMTEKILGMHFLYHTRFCEYDGWRPPKHEPILVIGMWLNNRQDPLKIDLEKRLALYKKFFPENQVKFDCSCGIAYSQNYHSDELWK